MFKHNKLFVSVLLVAAIVAGMVIPAAATSTTANGIYDSISYKWVLTREEAKGVSVLTTPGASKSISTKVYNDLFYDLTGTYSKSKSVTNSGYYSITAVSDNIMYVDTVPVRARIEETHGEIWICGTSVSTLKVK